MATLRGTTSGATPASFLPGRLGAVTIGGICFFRLGAKVLEWGRSRSHLASRAEESHLRALLKPCVNLSIHTASDVRLPTLKNSQWEKSAGLARRTRASHRLAPFVCPRRRLNFQRAHRAR